jgi:hypothetical protein
VTHFETIITGLGTLIGMISALIVVVWRTRGYVDRLNTTDSELAHAISDLGTTMISLHRENQTRFRRIESKLK